MKLLCVIGVSVLEIPITLQLFSMSFCEMASPMPDEVPVIKAVFILRIPIYIIKFVDIIY